MNVFKFHGYIYMLRWMVTIKILWPEHVSGTENGAEQDENRVEHWAGMAENDGVGVGVGAGAERSAEQDVAERKRAAGSGLNQPLTAHSNLMLGYLTLHWPYSSIVCSLLFSLHSLVFTLYSSLAMSLLQTQSNLYFFHLIQPKAILIQLRNSST